MVGMLTAALLLAEPLRQPLPPDVAFEAAAVPVPGPEDAFEAPPAPRWPGALAMWAGGSVLTVSTIYGAVTTVDTALFAGPGVRVFGRQAESLLNTGLLVGGGVFATLAGMGCLLWVQPEEEPRPKSPGFVALSVGITQVFGGILRALMVSDAEPFLSAERRSVGVVIGSGVIALAAGIAWLAWAAH